MSQIRALSRKCLTTSIPRQTSETSNGDVWVPWVATSPRHSALQQKFGGFEVRISELLKCSHTLSWTNVANYADQMNYTICGEEMETSPHHPPFSEMNLNNNGTCQKNINSITMRILYCRYLSMTFLVRCSPSFPPEDCPAIPGGWSYLPEQTTDLWDVSQATSLRKQLGKEPTKKS